MFLSEITLYFVFSIHLFCIPILKQLFQYALIFNDLQFYFNRNKSVEDLLISSREVMTNVSSTGLESQNPTMNIGNGISDNVQETCTSSGEKNSPVSSPNLSPRPSPKVRNKRDHSKANHDSNTKESNNVNKLDDQVYVRYYCGNIFHCKISFVTK